MRVKKKSSAFVGLFLLITVTSKLIEAQQQCASNPAMNPSLFTTLGSSVSYSSLLQVFTDYKFPCSGIVNQWDYIITRVPSQNQAVFFSVWRQQNPPNGTIFQLVGATRVTPALNDVGKLQTVIVPQANGIKVEAGDMIGMHYMTGTILQPDLMAIPFLNSNTAGVILPLPSRTIIWPYGDVEIYSRLGVLDANVGASVADNIRMPAIRAYVAAGNIVPTTQVPVNTTAATIRVAAVGTTVKTLRELDEPAPSSRFVTVPMVTQSTTTTSTSTTTTTTTTTTTPAPTTAAPTTTTQPTTAARLLSETDPTTSATPTTAAPQPTTQAATTTVRSTVTTQAPTTTTVSTIAALKAMALQFADYNINGFPVWAIVAIVGGGLLLLIVGLLVLLCYACCCRNRRSVAARPGMLDMDTQTDLPFRQHYVGKIDRAMNTKRSAWQEYQKTNLRKPDDANDDDDTVKKVAGGVALAGGATALTSSEPWIFDSTTGQYVANPNYVQAGAAAQNPPTYNPYAVPGPNGTWIDPYTGLPTKAPPGTAPVSPSTARNAKAVADQAAAAAAPAGPLHVVRMMFHGP